MSSAGRPSRRRSRGRGGTSAPTVSIEVRGLTELMGTFRRLDKEMRKLVRDKLKDAGGIIAKEAQSIARRKGLVDSGRLVRSIKVQVTRRGVAVVDRARRGGYYYPVRYEYARESVKPKALTRAGRAQAAVAARPFMRPAMEAKREEAKHKLDEALKELEGVWNAQ